MMRTMIVDDERLARQEIKRLLESFSEIEVIAESGVVDEALDIIEKEKPDLLLLDIQMPGKTGFELLDELNGPAPEVIFITAYDEYALQAFEVNALDYLMKPFDKNRLIDSVLKVSKRVEDRRESRRVSDEVETLSTKDQVFLKDGDKCWFVELSKVRLFESEGNYVRVYFDDQRPLILKSLNGLTERLNEKYFFRASRKHIVNLKWIDKVETWFNGGLLVFLKDGTKVEVSRRQSVRLKEMMAL